MSGKRFLVIVGTEVDYFPDRLCTTLKVTVCLYITWIPNYLQNFHTRGNHWITLTITWVPNYLQNFYHWITLTIGCSMKWLKLENDINNKNR